ncbi:MAG: hypothetical protein M1830_001762 [Pleopsidium flavum]|nr:MAG: hypothetical protein M1830_001762 [Pleopsidium flavum]
MPPALAPSDDDRETANSNGLSVTNARRLSTRSTGHSRESFTNDTARKTRANTALTSKPETALALASANVPDDELNNDNDDEEEEEEDYEDGDSEDEETSGFLSKPKLPPHQFASRSLFDIVQNFYVPPVIFNVQAIKAEDGTERWKRTCVDGKQRLTSIRDFMKGRIPCHDRKGATWHYCQKEDEDGHTVRMARRKILPEKIKEEFRSKQLVCYEFMNLTDAQERDLFQRVQKGIQLTKAEQFRATRGEWQTFAEMYERDFPKVVNLTVNSRASGFRNILTCFSQIYECQDPSAANGVPTLRSSVGAIESFLHNEPALNTRTRDHLRHVFTMFNDLVEEDLQTFQDNGYRRVKTFAPIELVAVSVLISQHGSRRPRGMLLGDIRALREHLRSTNIDLRMNKAVWSHAWEFIDDLEGQRGTVDSSTLAKKTAKPRQPRKPTIKTSAKVDRRAADMVQSPAPTGTHESAQHVKTFKAKETTAPMLSPRTQARKSVDLATSCANGTGSAVTKLPGRPLPTSARQMDAGGLAAYAARVEREDAERAASPSRDEIEIARHSPSSSSTSPSAADSLLEAPPAPELPAPLKRRANLDLGSGSTGARALVAKKAKLMGK